MGEKSKLLEWSDEVYKAVTSEKEAYWCWKQDQESDSKWEAVRQAKKVRKATVQRHKRRLDQKIVSRIETLQSKDPKEYWKQLKALDPMQQTSKKLPDTMMNEAKEMVSGAEGGGGGVGQVF